MLLSLNWLKKYVKLSDSITPDEISEMLSTSGFEIEEFTSTGCDIQGIVVGRVLECIDHPNSDHLHVTKMDIGATEPVQIVCGAPNIAAGQTVPIATVGTNFGGGFKIKKSKLRGEESNGMVCSEVELGVGSDHDGIMVLETELKSGTPITDYFEDNDVIFDISITPNRADCFNHVAIARELGVMFNSEFCLPEITLNTSNESSSDLISVELQDGSGCERFTARVIKNVKVAESPKWLKDALVKIGQRPINNLVDISNYVMFEYGQPLHFYDYDKVAGSKLIVRSANSGEKVITLDDKERELSDNVIVIEDAEKFACLGGMMGGQSTEVSDSTTNVLVEAAVWTQKRIFKIIRELGLNSEASYRFSKGVDFNGVIKAQNRSAELIQELCGGDISNGIVDISSKTVEPWTVSMRYERCNLILGFSVGNEKIDSILTSLELTKLNDTDWLIPTYRQDLTREIDLIEEVARIFGLDNIPSKTTMTHGYDIRVNEKDVFISELKKSLVSMGIQEIMTSSMVSSKEYESLSRSNPIKIMNPLTDDSDIMRTTMIPSMLKVMDYNVKRQQADCSFFEINKDYQQKKKKTVETQKLVIGITGISEEKHWDNTLSKVDFYDIKGIAESLLESLGLTNISFEVKEFPLLSGESVAIIANKNPIGFLGKIDSSVKKQLKLPFDSYVLELKINDLYTMKKGITTFKEISKFPTVERDIAVMVKKDISAEKLQHAIKEHCGDLLKSVSIFDLYTDKSFAKDEHSLAFKLYFGSNKTLTEEEINPLFYGSIDVLKEKFNAYLREA